MQSISRPSQTFPTIYSSHCPASLHLVRQVAVCVLCQAYPAHSDADGTSLSLACLQPSLTQQSAFTLLRKSSSTNDSQLKLPALLSKQNTGLMLAYCWPTVCDTGSILKHHRLNASCLHVICLWDTASAWL